MKKPLIIIVGLIMSFGIGVFCGYDVRELALKPFETADGKFTSNYLIYDLNKISYEPFRHSLYNYEFQYPIMASVRTNPDDYFDGNVFDEKNIEVSFPGITTVFSMTLIEPKDPNKTLEEITLDLYNGYKDDPNPNFYNKKLSKIDYNPDKKRSKFSMEYSFKYPPGGKRAMIKREDTNVIIENLKGQKFHIIYPTHNYLSEVILSTLKFF
jgi:hypothetical protein